MSARDRRKNRSSLVSRQPGKKRKSIDPSALIASVHKQTRQLTRKLDPTPPTPRVVAGELVPYVGRLTTRADWRKHYARVWRELRQGKLQPDLAARLLWAANLGWSQARTDESDVDMAAVAEQLKALREGTPLPALAAPADSSVLEHDDTSNPEENAG